MKDYTKYSSRIPSPKFKRTSSPQNGVATTTTRNVSSHPLSSPGKKFGNSHNNGITGGGAVVSPPDKREKDMDSPTGSNTSSGTPQQRQPPSQGGGSFPVQQATSRAVDYGTDSPNNITEQQQQNAELSIQRLKEQLNEALARDNTAKAALSKSDAVILDLRSNQRQLKRQIELLQKEKAEYNKDLQVAKIEASKMSSNGSGASEKQMETLKRQIEDLTRKLQEREQHQQRSQSNAFSKDAKVGELQVQLDRAHAQILTADMVRKELEDTLEAEQYTWELRVQDQEREITALQQECETLAQDLNMCRSQWKEAEKGWNEEIQQLQEQLLQTQKQIRGAANGSDVMSSASNNESLVQKIHQLETERAELQSCLDEALKELEAVDAELQTDDGGGNDKNNRKTTESLQHLLRWIYQEGPIEKRLNTSQLSSQDDASQLITQIQDALEEWLEKSATTNQSSKDRSLGGGGDNQDEQETMEQLNNRVKIYQAELKSREESSAELRESLKEAVALLKPLQDAVAQAEEEKTDLQQQVHDLEQDRQSFEKEMAQQSRTIESLEEQVSSLEQQLEEQRRLSQARESLLSGTPSPNKSRSFTSSPPDSDDSLAKIRRAREELRRKRETEGNLQQLLRDAQSRFKNLHQQNENVAAKNRELQGRIEKLGSDEQQTEENALPALLAQREAELRSLQEQLDRMQQTMEDPSSPDSSFQKVQTLEQELSSARGKLAQREQAERVLNKSLKEALGLLKPLQMHLEEAEVEKMEISKELRNLRKRFRQLQMGDDDLSKSTMGGHGDVSIELIKIKDELEETVRQLELENSQLHDALEDLTEDGAKHNEAKLRQHLVELNSRYEVTQNKLEDAHVENHALAKALKQKEMEEMKRKDEVKQMEEKLKKTEKELNNAKAIARSALVKVEELTMSNIENLSRQGSVDMNLSLEGPNQLSGFSF